MKRYDIFISYRRTSYDTANLIALKLMMAGYSVFIDLETLHGGKFNEQLYDVIDNCKDFILVLPPHALDRCINEKDWVRLETCRAMNHNKNIIPIMFKDFEWPHEMPEGMEELCNYHSLKMDSPEYFDMAIGRLQNRYLKSKKKKVIHKIMTLCLFFILPIMLYLIYYLFITNSNLYPNIDKYSINFSDTTLYKENGRLHFIAPSTRDSLMKFFKQAQDEYSDSHNGGDAKSQFILGNMCMNIDANRDMRSDGLYWLTLSARHGDAQAANALGRCYYHGIGVCKSPYKALRWFLISAEGGCAEGMNNAGKCYSEGSGTLFPNFPCFRKARKFYEHAGEKLSYPTAQYNLGVCYLVGSGGEKDIKEGMRLLKSAAVNNSVSAQIMLGDIYKNGLFNITKDTIHARKWYKKAKENGLAEYRRIANDELFKLENGSIN